MLHSMTWEQLSEWHDYAMLEPFGEERDDLRMGVCTSTLRNTLLAVNSGGKPVPRRLLSKPVDFVLRFDQSQHRAPKPMTKEQFRRNFNEFKALVAATAGR